MGRTYHDFLIIHDANIHSDLKVVQVIAVQLEEILGTQCIVASVQLWNTGTREFGDALVFLDPYSLRPIRTPIVLQQETAQIGVVSDQRKSLMVATLRPSDASDSAVAVWDVSNMAERQLPPLLHQCPQGKFALRNLCLVTREKDERWDAYLYDLQGRG